MMIIVGVGDDKKIKTDGSETDQETLSFKRDINNLKQKCLALEKDLYTFVDQIRLG